MSRLMQSLAVASDLEVEYPCSGDDTCAWCPTKLNHYNTGVLCNPCRRFVTGEINELRTEAEIRQYQELLCAKRPRNRRFVPSEVLATDLLERAVVPLVRRKGHRPQEGHQ